MKLMSGAIAAAWAGAAAVAAVAAAGGGAAGGGAAAGRGHASMTVSRCRFESVLFLFKFDP